MKTCFSRASVHQSSFFSLQKLFYFTITALFFTGQVNLNGQTGQPVSSTVPINLGNLMEQLQDAPQEGTAKALSSPTVVSLPMPEGGERPFKFVRNNLMAPDFAAQYPDFKTYKLQAADEPGVTGRATVTPYGLIANLFTPQGMIEISPENLLAPVLHKVSIEAFISGEFSCGFDESYGKSQVTGLEKAAFTNGATRRTYELAIVTTGEFGQTHGGTVPSATAVVVAQINALEDIYEKELAVRFTLLTPLIYLDPNTDPFPNNGERTLMAAEAIAANWPTHTVYDLGHCLHSSGGGAGWGGGVAYFGLCNIGIIPGGNGTGRYKGGAWSSVGNSPAGSLKLFAHEVGHQFYMPHTFNGTGGSCTGNIDDDHSFEIASGTTIMSYNGICSASQNIPSGGTADHYFYNTSLEAAINRMNATNCETGVASGNAPPMVNANPCGGGTTIPKGTPFRLTGSGTDPDGDVIHYTWEQTDEDGAGTPTQGFIGAQAAGSTIAPLFRAYPPTTSPTRTFPNMALVAANNYTSDFEPLPSVARTLNFQLTGRDWKTVGGGVNSAVLALTISNSGPFAVTAPNGGENLTAGNNTNVTWNVNGTNAFCNNVNIKLSIDGGLTYPYSLAANTPNDGSQSVTIPANATNSTQARVMVECADNTCIVFFDISNANFTINSTCGAASSNICPTATVSLPAGDPGLDFDFNLYRTAAVNSHSFTVTAGDPTMNRVRWNNGRTLCIAPGGTPPNHQIFSFVVEQAGNYGFSFGGGNFRGVHLFATTFNPAGGCTNFVASSVEDGAGYYTGIVSVPDLNPCTVYHLVGTNEAFGGNTTVTFSGPGPIYPVFTSPANYAYTYVAVNTANNQVAAVSATANFTALNAGSYQVYGASYYNGAGPNPPVVNPATWVGQTISQILSGGNCVLFSANFKPVTVTGPGGGPPNISIAATDANKAEGNAGPTPFTFTVTRTGDVTNQTTANWAVTGSGANPANGADFTGGNFPNGMITFPAGSVAAQTITVNVNGDLDVEPNEGFTVTLSNPVNATITTASANGTIQNDDAAPAYCAAGATNTGFEKISNVLFNTINNASTSTAGYEDFTAISTTVLQGSTHAFTGTISNPFASDQIIVWIDYNQDLIFDDPGEQVFISPTGAGPHSGNITIPGGAMTGNTRMRVRLHDAADGPNATPCGNSTYGQVEDYTINITAGCTPPVVNAPTVTQPICATPTGTIVVNATGGGTLEYSINNGTNYQVSSTFSGLAAGNYNIRVRLQANPTCNTAFANNPVVINAAPAAPVVNAPTVTQPTCAVPTGTIVVNATGGGTLEYSINNGTTYQVSSTFSGLAAGNYNIRVRLQANPTCNTAYANNPVVINAPPAAPVVNAPTVTQPTCATPTGTIVVNATGAGTLEYSINNGTTYQVSSTFSGLAAGNYNIRVRLQANPTCNTAYAANPVVLTPAVGCCPTYVSTDVPKAISAGAPPIVVTSTLNIPASGTITDVNVLNLTVTHTWISDLRITLTSPANTNVILLDQICGSESNILINFDDESPNNYASIPCPPNGVTHQPNQALSAFDGENLSGTWTLTLEDLASGDGGSLEAWSLQICSDPINCTPPVVNAPTLTQPTCAVPTGTIVVNATGTGTLEYSINNGTNYQASSTFSGLAAGNYNIRVRLQADPTCNTAFANNPVVINAAPATPVVNAPTVTQPTCAVPTGTIVVNATGTGTLEYSINNGTTYQASSTFSGLAAGNYTIRVRLQANPTCNTAFANNPVVINAAPAAPVVNAPTVTQPTCAVPTGTIVVNATGTGTLEYSINNGATYQASSTFSGLAAGNYNIRVRLQANPTCNTAFANNPVTLTASTGCCPNNLAVNNNPIVSGTYQASEVITSTGTVPNGNNVVFGASMSVELLPNFEVLLGGLFEITTVGCVP